MKSGLLGWLKESGDRGIQDELLAMPDGTMQSSFISVIINFLGFIIGFLLLMNRFDNRIGCFLWYVLLPVVFNIISVLLYKLFISLTSGKEHDFYTSYRYIIPGAFINLFSYCYIVVIYRSIPQVWLIGFMPVMFACYFKDSKWFKVQSILQCLFLALMFAIRGLEMPYSLWDVSKGMQWVFFAMVLIQFSRALFWQDRLKRDVLANISAQEAGMEVRRVFEANLSNDCQSYLDTIDNAAMELSEENGEGPVYDYAQKIIHASGRLKEALSEGTA